MSTPVVHGCLNRPHQSVNVASREQASTHHAPESFLSCRIPQLQSYPDAIYKQFLRNKKCSGGGRRVLRLELVLGISVQQAGLSDPWKRRTHVSIRLTEPRRACWGQRSEMATDLCCPLLRSWRRRLGHIWPANKGFVPETPPSTLQNERNPRERVATEGRGKWRGGRRDRAKLWAAVTRGCKRQKRSELREPRAPVLGCFARAAGRHRHSDGCTGQRTNAGDLLSTDDDRGKDKGLEGHTGPHRRSETRSSGTGIREQGVSHRLAPNPALSRRYRNGGFQ